MTTKHIILTSSTATRPVDTTRISDDGRFIAYVQQGSTAGSEQLVTKDLVTGQATIVNGAGESIYEYDLSADGSSIAYFTQTAASGTLLDKVV